MTEENVAVLVTGAGLAGLTATVVLAQHGIRVLAVDRHPGTSIHPRASGQSPFSTELLSFEQDDDGVTAMLNTGTVRAKYLVAADGGRGAARRRLGIPTHGMGTIGQAIGVVFDAALGDRLQPDITDLYYLRHPRFIGALINTDSPGRFVFGTDLRPENGDKVEDFTEDRVTELIRLATDLPGLEPDIRWIGAWEIAARVATRFRAGRVLLAGDAAKVTPPTGGMGGNTAVGDGHDVAWKLAAVLRGEAGPGLLDSYEAERRAFAEMVVNASLHNMKQRMRPGLDLTGLPDPEDPVELALGYRCRSAAVVIDDDDPRATENPNKPSGRAGFRAPHVPITLDGAPMSTVDLFGHGWVLMTTDPAWREAAASVRPAVTPRVLGEDFTAAEDLFTDRYGIGPGGATLVRTDGVVAWRTVRGTADRTSALAGVLDRVLCR